MAAMNTAGEELHGGKEIRVGGEGLILVAEYRNDSCAAVVQEKEQTRGIQIKQFMKSRLAGNGRKKPAWNM
ncbi:hypothetical protein XELAEV_18023151mg [Xenopus laevis]|uniref:Uncharacterized protein n=1 Tax=Xenopus laevis TaxID=8355 RepID=A0A974D6J4_XENLA|nr:hypothetical protein XELAEV_18023151mg [Xenopus laevis]